MTNQIVVTNMAHLNALQHHIPGELAYVEETKEIYMWDEDKGWQLLQIDNKGIDFNLYDLNKNVINQLSPLTSDEIYSNIEMLNNYHNETNNS